MFAQCTVKLLCIKIELHIFLSSPLGNGGACFGGFEQPPRLANEGLGAAGPLISIVSLTHYCCSQKGAPGGSRPSPPARRLQCPRPAQAGPQDPARSPPGSSVGGETAPASGVPGERCRGDSLSPATEPSPVSGLP